MRRVLMVALSLFLVGSLVLAGGAKVPLALAQQEAEIKPVEIEVVKIEAPQQTVGFMPLIITFKVKNPNSIEVTLDEMEYLLWFRNFTLSRVLVDNDVYIPPESEVMFDSSTSVDLIYGCIGNVAVAPGQSLGSAFAEGASMWKEMGGTAEGIAWVVDIAVTPLLPVIVGDALAKLGIPEAISKPVMMMVVMPLLAWIIPKLAVIVSDIVWAAAEGVEPPPTYKAEGTVTMIAGGETRYIDFSQSCEATVPPLPPPLTISLEAGGLL